MSAERLCPHDDDPLCCPPCQRTSPRAATCVEAIGPWPARYSGSCRGCSFGVVEGQLIVRLVVEGETVGYAHAGACTADACIGSEVIT